MYASFSTPPVVPKSVILETFDNIVKKPLELHNHYKFNELYLDLLSEKRKDLVVKQNVLEFYNNVINTCNECEDKNESIQMIMLAEDDSSCVVSYADLLLKFSLSEKNLYDSINQNFQQNFEPTELIETKKEQEPKSDNLFYIYTGLLILFFTFFIYYIYYNYYKITQFD
jgi:hypothetical protein